MKNIALTIFLVFTTTLLYGQKKNSKNRFNLDYKSSLYVMMAENPSMPYAKHLLMGYIIVLSRKI